MHHLTKSSWILTVCLILFAGSSQAQLTFTEVGAARGIGPFEMEFGKGGGVAAADFDDDGDIDLYVPNVEGAADHLYRNLGNGHFEDIAVMAGLGSTARGRAALWFDYDGDHLLDLFIASDCSDQDASCPATSSHRLYRQVSPAQFMDVTVAAGLSEDEVTDTLQHRGGISAGDINNDGYLDLITGLWEGPAQVFRNNGNGTFTDIAAASGLDALSHYWQPLMHDWNGDGLLDIYYAIDFAENLMLINQGNLSFTDFAASSGSDSDWNDMGMTQGDYDNDGDMDLYITNITFVAPPRNNVLFRNDSTLPNLTFTRKSHEAGVANGFWGWGTTFLDADNDGDLDLAATNGFDQAPGISDPSRFFLNVGGSPLTFDEVSDAVGFNDTFWGSSLIAADTDRDGDLDMIQTCNGSGDKTHELRLLENSPGNSNNYLVVKPRMSGTNHRAIGAIVRIEVGATQMMRVITAGTSFMGQEPAEAHFGVGAASTVDKVTIEWLGGGFTTEITEVAANQVLTLRTLFYDGFESGDTTAWSNVVP